MHARDFPERASRTSRQLALLLPSALAIGLWRDSLAPLALAGPLGLGALVAQLAPFGDARTLLPNALTALRVLLTAGLALWPLEPAQSAALVGLVFTLDGLDGHLARRTQACSPQGAHFDMEADAYLVLTVCALLARAGLGAWVLLGGLLRYSYVLATWLLPAGGEAPRSRFGRYAFAAALGALTGALLARGVPALALAALGTGVLAWSFGRSFAWVFAARR